MLNLLVRIAQEKVGYDFNYPGAIKFLQEAIPDIPIELCNGLILGTHSITNINGFDFDIEDIPNENTLNIIELIRVKHDSIEESYTGDTPINYTVERIRDNFNKL